MAVLQNDLTAQLNNTVTVYHGSVRTQGQLTDDGSGVGADSIKVLPVNSSAEIIIPKASISGLSF